MKITTFLSSGLMAFSLLGTSMIAVTMVSGETVAAQEQSAKAIVDSAIKKGIVGETNAGYLALVNDDASEDIVDAMNEINIGRKIVYMQLAKKQKVQIEAVATLTGEKQLAKAKPGSKLLNKEGRWVTVK